MVGELALRLVEGGGGGGEVVLYFESDFRMRVIRRCF